MLGRWVGLSYDGPIISGWGTIARTEAAVTELMGKLRDGGTAAVQPYERGGLRGNQALRSQAW